MWFDSTPASPLLIVSLPPPTRVGTCLLFQVSSFKLLGLEYPPCPPLPPRAALSRILGASLLGHSPHRISPPSLPLLCGVNGERFYRLSPLSSLPPAPTCARASWPPPLTLSPNTCLPHRIIPSLHLPPCVCVCVCKRSELDLTLPLPSLFPPRWGSARTVQHLTLINLMMVRGLRSARSVSSHTWPFSRQSPVSSCLSLCLPCPPLSIISLSLAESHNLGLGLLSLCGVCVECVKCVECVFVHGNSAVGGLYHSCGIMTVIILSIIYPQQSESCGSFMVLIWDGVIAISSSVD